MHKWREIISWVLKIDRIQEHAKNTLESQEYSHILSTKPFIDNIISFLYV